MTRLRHTCGQLIDYRKVEGLIAYQAEFFSIETARPITGCPKCHAQLYGELVHGRLGEAAEVA